MLTVIMFRMFVFTAPIAVQLIFYYTVNVCGHISINDFIEVLCAYC